MSYQIELFHSLLQDFLKGESALVQTTGEVIGVNGADPISFGTLTTAASTVSKYLKLAEGDIALLNDPYSGGSLLCDITFVMALSDSLLWVSRHSFDKGVKLAKSVEDEGLRIPPTPLRQNNQMNDMILAAMQSHPACPPRLVEWLKAQCEVLTQRAQQWHQALKLTGFNPTAELIEEYLELSRQAAVQKISERASGEARIDLTLDSGELLRMNMEIQDGKISLDFSGTSAAKTVSLTESATYGTCFHALSRFYGFDHFANSGSFSIMQITKPSGCWLVGKYPAPTFKGMTCGVAAIKTVMELALSQIHHKNEKALSSHCALYVDLQHRDRHVHMTLNGGKGARADQDGDCAHIHSLSIEQLERDFPLKVQRVDLRQSPGGKGKFNGGRGLIVKIEVQGEINATWVADLTSNRPRIPKSSSYGDVSEISVERDGQQKILPVLGQEKFKAGDILTLCSGSGGGFGKE